MNSMKLCESCVLLAACLNVYVCVELEARCEQLMMMKFGRLVDLEALQTLSGSRMLEEMRQESRVKEGEYRWELKLWQVHTLFVCIVRLYT